MNGLHQIRAYKNNQITTTDPGTVLLMLYRGTIDSLKRAKVYMIAGQMAEKGKEILRANDIINQFLAALDYEVAGELARNLEGLYRYMLDQILIANAKNEPRHLETVISLLLTLEGGWGEAVAAQRKKSAQGGA